MLKTEDEYGGSGGHGNGWGMVICEACERCPAEFICKADAASLCAACDAEIHSANPLARRHQRVPICRGGVVFSSVEEEDEEEAASWLLMNPTKNNKNNSDNNNNGMFLLGGEDEEEEDDEYLKFVEFNGNNDEDEDEFEGLKNNNYGGDSVVPIDQFEGNKEHHHQQQQQQNHEILLEQSYGGLVDASEFFHSSSKPPYSYNAFLTHTISASSMEVGVVPDSSTTTMSDISISNMRPPKGTIDLFSGTTAAEAAAAIQMPATQLSPMDREARVLRYREKKKTRKFEKTIRYASRKAYAETRPRIKGRFAKRTDVEVQLDRKYSNPLIPDAGYGIVPSF
ncbi:zinc finger protein CONSTANS-LIKE 2-like [Benincasa hispida]|uniref:zinc finger protein CONSTANS-LIKE 2-like n=1 Tax=Benincasa hispida TaxID=102211 RepID=UPI0018FFE623|nr:zinc finger protein CONSTANS-LIKE 2-like [Benincasa hispida]